MKISVTQWVKKMEIILAHTEDEISHCFKLLSELRPHLTLNEFIEKVTRMRVTTGYKLAYLNDDGIKAVAGIKISEWLHTGTYLEIEELVTAKNERSKGYGGKLFDWIFDYAKQNKCNQISLVSGVTRENAHRFYLTKGMTFEAKYFSIDVE